MDVAWEEGVAADAAGAVFGGDIVTFPETAEIQYIPGLPWLARKLGVIAE